MHAVTINLSNNLLWLKQLAEIINEDLAAKIRQVILSFKLINIACNILARTRKNTKVGLIFNFGALDPKLCIILDFEKPLSEKIWYA